MSSDPRKCYSHSLITIELWQNHVSVVIAMTPDGLEPWGAGTSADTVMTKFRPCIPAVKLSHRGSPVTCQWPVLSWFIINDKWAFNFFNMVHFSDSIHPCAVRCGVVRASARVCATLQNEFRTPADVFVELPSQYNRHNLWNWGS